MAKDEIPANQVWIDADSGTLDALREVVDVTTDARTCPRAMRIEKNTPIYDGAALAGLSSAERLEMMAEWTRVFSDGPGIICIKSGIVDGAVLDRATALFETLIEEERGTGGGDHFAKPGANDRVWNAAQKHCVHDPEGFAAYFATPAVDMASRAWLGDGYQVTAQVNRVNPGGAAQTAHRDYHLGFMPTARMAQFPAHVHQLSPMLTLQGAVAHCDMPLESGPTLYLPYSQKFFHGYLAFNRPEFQEYFAQNHVQLPLSKGDMVFFNPAVMHGAGNNISKDIKRLANLLQIGSAFGRSIEAVDRAAMVTALYPILLEGGFDAAQITRIIAASAEGYAFPTNLDRDPPVGSMNPQSQADIMADALQNRLPSREFAKLVEAWTERRRA